MDETRIRRVRFRAWRRGFLEADLILGPFAEIHAQKFDKAELADFESLLEENDHDLWAWMTGAAPPPAKHAGAMFAKLRDYVERRGRSR